MIRKTISMPDAMGDWITERVKSGQYNNESEYIRDLVRQDQAERAKMEFLSGHLAESQEDYKAGRTTRIQSQEDLKTFFNTIKSSE